LRRTSEEEFKEVEQAKPCLGFSPLREWPGSREIEDVRKIVEI
jgi:hypothetical protein